MTPERIEEIKQNYSGGVVGELLAALEESQGDIITLNQKVELYEEALDTYKDNRADMKRQLAESQQTIARQQEALEYIIARAEIELNEIETNTYNLSNGLTMIRKKAHSALGEGAKES